MTKRILALTLTLLMLIFLCIFPHAEDAAAQDEVTILFTSDLHSLCFRLPTRTG